VRRLIAGRCGYICDECVAVCSEAVRPPVTDKELWKSITVVWSEFTRRRQWAAATLVGALAQMADDEDPQPRTWSRGAMMTSYVLNQLNPPQQFRLNLEIRCDYCSRPGDETRSMTSGHRGNICSDCQEQMLETRAWWNPAYREELIRRLTALADMPEPPHGTSG